MPKELDIHLYHSDGNDGGDGDDDGDGDDGYDDLILMKN